MTVSGGKGAPGKRGEDGMPGQNGWDGVDATQYSPGTDGANGGRGTDGKPGTSGGNGGDGGDVNIRVSDADTDLLALLRVTNTGGAGGEPGAHGQGGNGGMPGKGGRPHSWTTSHQVAVRKTRWEEYKAYEPNNPAAVGGMVTRSDLVYYTDYETRYQQHHQPGGRDGHRGAPGATPTTPLSSGRPGRNGGLAIHVHTTDGIKTYSGPFDLTLESFGIATALNNGVYEPGESVEISRITIKNNGAMPTPDGSRIKIFLRQDDWIVCVPQELYLLGSIAPGQAVTIQGTMKFQIKEYSGRSDEAYEETEVLDLGAATARFGTPLPRFTHGHRIVVSHPIEVSKVSAPGSVLPGEVSKISFQIRNTSKKQIGSAALQKELQRTIKLALNIKSEKNAAGTLVFCDAKGVAQKSAVLERSISSIAPGRTATVSCHVKLTQSLQNHNIHTITGKLFLEKIGETSALKRIQTEEIEIKEGIGYQPKTNDDFLLVTNLTTSPDELQAWGDLAKSLGLSFSIWDVSVHGHLELSAKGPHGSLLERWKDKSIVLLNQRSSGDGDHEAAPSDLLSLTDLDSALRLSNLKVYPVGDLYAMTNWPSVCPTVTIKKTENFKDLSSFTSALRREPPATSTLCTISVGRYTHPFSTPPKKHFDDEVIALKKLLEERFPKDKFLVQPRYSLTTTTRYSFTGVQYDTLGEIVVRRQETAKDSILIGTAVDAASAHSRHFVTSKLNATSLIAAMPNRQLSQVVARFLRNQASGQGALEAVCGGLLKKIMLEADMTEKHEKAQFPGGIPILDTLAEILPVELGASSRPDPKRCASVIAYMTYYSARRLSWKQAFMVFGTAFKVSEIFDSRIAKIEKHLLRIFDKQNAALYRQTKRDVLSSLRKEFASTSRGDFERFVTEGTPYQRVAGVTSWTINPYLR